MPKGFFTGKSRQSETISHPALQYTDAIPRNDLHFNAGTCRPPTFHRPRTSNRQQKQRPPDLNNAVPPSETISPRTAGNVEENMIGIALGSPRLVESQMYSHMRDDSYCSTVGRRHDSGKSRWRKIGGLFKAKRAFTPSQPFYQVRVNNDWPLQKSTYSMNVDEQKAAIQQPLTEEWPRLKSEPRDHGTQGSRAKPDATSDSTNSSPRLQVDIPSVQMERYSVMFSGLLGKPPTRKSRIIDSSSALYHDLPPPPRPATSPTRPKSPSFTLFPATHTSKPSKVLGTQTLPVSSPLIRSQTAPPDQRSEKTLWTSQGTLQSPLPSPTSRHHSDSSSTTIIDLNDAGPPLQISKPSNPVRNKHKTLWPHANPETERVTPPALKINTNVQPFGHTPRIVKPAPRSSSLSPNAALRPLPQSGHQAQHQYQSPSPKHKSETPNSASPRMPLTDEEDEPAPVPDESIPKIEVSVARSVSVSRGNKQAIVPVRRTDCLDPDERIVEKGAKTPIVMDGEYGHRPGNSQELRIESV
ncbi:hypothetical protein PHISCL_02943 [Aspergillus sclerotialis]|uniref:Uncharacterized protein n=1 Tax=Aspergillus sclerotialis TaxID=2070753 RepID=A0A3A2ZZD2_9EURO|nr:hypothetical protein PHISCL_02943 [Aspergillus sclerotialis]